MHDTLNQLISTIAPVNTDLQNIAQTHLDDLTKPQGSLARLEELATKVFCIQSGKIPLKVNPACMFTVAADHGIVSEGIASYPQEVTRQMVLNFLAGGAGISVLCHEFDVDLSVVDAGCVGGAFAAHAKLIDMRLGDGTNNFAKGPAMSRELCLKALCNGASLAEDAAKKGYKTIGIGEMGIGNTTAATAIFCAMLGLEPKDVAGPGAGASAELIAHKAAVIKKALELHNKVITDGDGIDILAYVGGFEIATMAGLMLGAAKSGCIVLVDGFISTAAYVAAKRICPHVKDYCILSHASAEPGYVHVLKALNEPQPLLHLGLRLGEGTGAALAVPILRAAAAIYNDMATFSSAGVTGETCL